MSKRISKNSRQNGTVMLDIFGPIGLNIISLEIKADISDNDQTHAQFTYKRGETANHCMIDRDRDRYIDQWEYTVNFSLHNYCDYCRRHRPSIHVIEHKGLDRQNVIDLIEEETSKTLNIVFTALITVVAVKKDQIDGFRQFGFAGRLINEFNKIG